MKVIDPGHFYELSQLDGRGEEPYLVFVKREGEGYPGNVGHHAGTTLQEVLRACIARVEYLHGQIPDNRNQSVVADLRHAIYLLEQRAAERHNRDFTPVWLEIEKYPTCEKCLHIGCNGQCHP